MHYAYGVYLLDEEADVVGRSEPADAFADEGRQLVVVALAVDRLEEAVEERRQLDGLAVGAPDKRRRLIDRLLASPEHVRHLCDRHRGVGADGILEIVDVRGPEAEVVVWNADGSTAELSGNGTRIAARWLARRSGEPEVPLVLAGNSGPRLRREMSERPPARTSVLVIRGSFSRSRASGPYLPR